MENKKPLPARAGHDEILEAAGPRKPLRKPPGKPLRPSSPAKPTTNKPAQPPRPTKSANK